MHKTDILGVQITTSSKSEIIEYITKSLTKSNNKFYVVTPNPEIVMFAQSHPRFEAILNNAVVSLPDGIGVVWGAKLLKKGVESRVTGVDVMQELCKEAVRNGLELGFLGGQAGVAEKTAECLTKKYPGLKVGFVGEEWLDNNRFKNNDLRFKNKKIINHKSYLMNQHIDILFVAYGFPKQEEWIAENLPHIPVTCAMGVGGAFDIISGRVPRAPKLVRSLGLEWLFRLIVQPWRWKRQLVLVRYVILIFKEYLKMRLREVNK